MYTFYLDLFIRTIGWTHTHTVIFTCHSQWQEEKCGAPWDLQGGGSEKGNFLSSTLNLIHMAKRTEQELVIKILALKTELAADCRLDKRKYLFLTLDNVSLAFLSHPVSTSMLYSWNFYALLSQQNNHRARERKKDRKREKERKKQKEIVSQDNQSHLWQYHQPRSKISFLFCSTDILYIHSVHYIPAVSVCVHTHTIRWENLVSLHNWQRETMTY